MGRRNIERPPLTDAQQKLVHGALNYVKSKARWAARHYSGTSHYQALLDEYTAAGYLGCCIAATKFEPERGLHFLTYADNWIRQHIQRCRHDHHPLGPGFARRGYSYHVGRVGTKSKDDETDRTIDPPAPPESPDPEAFSERVKLILKQIPNERDRQILLLYYVDGMTLLEIGEIYGLSRERIRQLLEKQVARLRCLKPLRDMNEQAKRELIRG